MPKEIYTSTAPATTTLLGRKNYIGFGGYWPGVADDETADPRDRAFSKWLNSVEKIVFSSTLKEATWENSRIVDTNPAQLIEELQQQEGGDIIVFASSSVIQPALFCTQRAVGSSVKRSSTSTSVPSAASEPSRQCSLKPSTCV